MHIYSSSYCLSYTR